MGRWHLKSLIVTSCLLLLLIYYAHKKDFKSQSGVKARKRDLIVRAAKPYKSPFSRRRHARPFKDDKTGLLGKLRENDDLVQLAKTHDPKLDKTKSGPNDSTFIPANALLQHTEKDLGATKSILHQTDDAFYQENQGRGQILNTHKDIHKNDNKKYLPRSSGGVLKNVIIDQKSNKGGATSLHQLPAYPQAGQYLKAPGATNYATNRLTQKSKTGISEETRLRTVLKPAVKVKRNFGEVHTAM